MLSLVIWMWNARTKNASEGFSLTLRIIHFDPKFPFWPKTFVKLALGNSSNKVFQDLHFENPRENCAGVMYLPDICFIHGLLQPYLCAAHLYIEVMSQADTCLYILMHHKLDVAFVILRTLVVALYIQKTKSASKGNKHLSVWRSVKIYNINAGE